MAGPPKHTPKQLYVEGIDDKQSVLGLARHHLQWPVEPEKSPVLIVHGNGAEDMLRPAFLRDLVKSPPIQIIGLMFDADTALEQRYRRIKATCAEYFPKLPDSIPDSGVIVENEDGRRLGIWFMPDNVAPGDLEAFLRYLVPEESEPLWQCALEAIEKARTAGAPYRDSHTRKACLYTWLAWQDPPSQSPGTAITKKILDPNAGLAVKFTEWFMNLYGLQRAN
jgi:hypothetical protein